MQKSGALRLGDDDDDDGLVWEMRARVSGQGCQFEDRGGNFNYPTTGTRSLVDSQTRCLLVMDMNEGEKTERRCGPSG